MFLAFVLFCFLAECRGGGEGPRGGGGVGVGVGLEDCVFVTVFVIGLVIAFTTGFVVALVAIGPGFAKARVVLGVWWEAVETTWYSPAFASASGSFAFAAMVVADATASLRERS